MGFNEKFFATASSPSGPSARIANTVQFNGTSTPTTGLQDVLYRVPSSASNRRTWTWSGWVKRLSTSDTGFGIVWNGGNFGTSGGLVNFINCNWKGNGKLGIYTATGGAGGQQHSIESTSAFTDTSKYHHIVYVLDTTNTTAADRTRIYFDGSRLAVATEVGTGTPALNFQGAVNDTSHYGMIGQYAYATGYTGSFSGRMALMDFVDGQALDPTYFGGTVGSNWLPKTYDGSFGTNGYRLYLANSSSLGTDTSGNSNTYTSNGLAVGDVNSETIPS
tara:strand:- start:54 stop:881 length:828 start_codon:yes stop_codon:yes gene_type:complete